MSDCKEEKTAKKDVADERPKEVTESKDNTNKSKTKTLYWGISLDREMILNHESIKSSVGELNPNKEMHSTLLFVGRKPTEKEEKFLTHENKKCKLIVNSYGVSDKALCLKVSNMEFLESEKEDNKEVPSDATFQHITVALADGSKAKDSPEAFKTKVVELEEPLTLYGIVKRY